MSDHITLSELKALLNDLPEDRIVNIMLTIDAPEHLEKQLSDLRANLQIEQKHNAALIDENEYLRDLLYDIGIPDPDTLNSTQREELKAAVANVWQPYFVTDKGRAAAQMFRKNGDSA